MPSMFDRLNSTSQNVALSGLSNGAKNINSERIVDIDLSLIDDMEGNETVFGYDEDEINFLISEIKASGFHDPITVSQRPGGRYVCISGHQRKLALQKLGYDKIPCYIAKDLTEKQERDLWRSSNLIHRKLSPYNYAKLIESYMQDYKKYDVHGYGGQREYAAQKCGIGNGSVRRYQNILKMPQGIQEHCKNPDFPYIALLEASKFDNEQLLLLEQRIDQFYSLHKNTIMTKQDLLKIIAKVEEDSKYEDTSGPEASESSNGSSNAAREMIEKQYKLYLNSLKEKTKDKYLTERIVYADDVLSSSAEEFYAIINSDHYAIANEVSARNAIRVMKDSTKKLESRLTYK